MSFENEPHVGKVLKIRPPYELGSHTQYPIVEVNLESKRFFGELKTLVSKGQILDITELTPILH